MMIEINGLCKRFGDFQALQHLNLSIEKGELFGFVGHNGAGKTTTMRIISGLLAADEGEVYVDGIDALSNNTQLKSKIGYVPDFFGVYDNLKTMEYLEFYASIYGITGNKSKKLCRSLLDLVHLESQENSYVDSLSRGMKQRLCIARSLVHNPQVLILDEPASGMDPSARYEMKEILRCLHDKGKTVIISSHILSELPQLCTTIGIITEGQMAIKGTVEEIMQQVNTTNPLVVELLGEQEKAVGLLKQHPMVDSISLEQQKLLLGFQGDHEAESQLLQMLIQQGIPVSSFYRETGDLESVFMKISGAQEVLTREK